MSIIPKEVSLTSQYDEIASQYDELFTDKESLKENKEVANLLKAFNGSVYEIGCGTGLFLELYSVCPDKYMGIDPSNEMLKLLKKKHPTYLHSVYNIAFEEDDILYMCYDNIISLFGSISYVNKNSLVKIADSGKDYFLLFYKSGYNPVTYEKTNVCFTHNETDIFFINKVFPNATLQEFNNYLIVRSK